MADGATAEHSHTGPRIYLASLDGLRFIAFALVLFSHVHPPKSYTVLFEASRRSWVGVELFFVISSFLFFTLFQAEYQRTGRIALADFFVRRLLRVYPLMIAAPIISMVVMYGHYDQINAWSELAAIATFGDNLMGHPWFRRAIPFAEHLWTLSFEFQIYLVLPAFFYACVKLGRGRALIFLGLVWLACVGLRAHYAIQAAPHPTIYFNPILRPDSVLFGMALALIAGRAASHTPLVAVALVVSIVAFLSIPNVFVAGPSNIPLFMAAAAMSGSLLWLSIKAPWFSKVLSVKWIVYLGKRSFGLYVFHVAATICSREVLVPWLGIESEGAQYAATLVLAFLLSVGMAVLSYRFIERPFLILKDSRAVVLSRPV